MFVLTPEQLIIVVFLGSVFLDCSFLLQDRMMYWFWVKVLEREDFEGRYVCSEGKYPDTTS